LEALQKAEAAEEVLVGLLVWVVADEHFVDLRGAAGETVVHFAADVVFDFVVEDARMEVLRYCFVLLLKWGSKRAAEGGSRRTWEVDDMAVDPRRLLAAVVVGVVLPVLVDVDEVVVADLSSLS
jgi:hypothetical protein